MNKKLLSNKFGRIFLIFVVLFAINMKTQAQEITIKDLVKYQQCINSCSNTFRESCSLILHQEGVLGGGYWNPYIPDYTYSTSYKTTCSINRPGADNHGDNYSCTMTKAYMCNCNSVNTSAQNFNTGNLNLRLSNSNVTSHPSCISAKDRCVKSCDSSLYIKITTDEVFEEFYKIKNINDKNLLIQKMINYIPKDILIKAYDPNLLVN